MSTRLATVGAIGLLATAFAEGASAQARVDRDSPMMVNPNFQNIYVPHVDCHIYGGTGIVLQNEGIVPIAAGAAIHWALTTGASGTYVLPVPLVGGDAILIENALRWPVLLSTVCHASLV